MTRLQRHDLASNAVFAPHEAVEAGPWKVHPASPNDGPMRIAVLGALADHKGARTVASVAERVDPKNIEIHLIGHTDGPFSEVALERMRVTGPYDKDGLSGWLDKIAPHLVWFPAAWPETFSYTLSAAIDAGIPIAATRIGAHTERLEGRPSTWLADVATSPSGWTDLFEEIRSCLTAGGDDAAITARPEVEDYYARHYLVPRINPKPACHRTGLTLPRIAVVPERFDIGLPTPCGYIRLLQPLHHPSLTQAFRTVVTDATSMFDTAADIIIAQRYAIPDLRTADRLAAHARRSGATIVYDLDDHLLHIPDSHPEARHLRPRSKVIRRMLEVADVVFVSTPCLADYLTTLRPDAIVMENRLDERIWTPPVLPARDQPLRILCMGTTTHDDDFKLIEPALIRIKDEYGSRVAIDVVGMTNQHDLPPGLNRLTLPTMATRSYPGLVQFLTSAAPTWHIGLAPLLDTPFNRAKSAIKAMDYAAMGMVVLASDALPYRGSIADGPAGRLVENTEEAWHAALDGLIRDRERRRAIASGSRAAFLAEASLASSGDLRRAAWRRLLDDRHSRAA